MRGAVIAAAAVLTAGATPSFAQSVIEAVPARPRIVVTGFGEVKTTPDVATISYTIRGEGPSSDDAVRAMTMTGSKIKTALRAIDAAADPTTSEVRVAAVKNDNCRDQGYGNPQLSIGVCAIVGYVATQSVTLRTLSVKDAGTMVGLAGRAGALTPRINGFNLRDSHVAQQQAIMAALADAATKAAAIAAASHVQLGPILSITSGPRNDAQQIIVSGTRVLSNELPMVAPPPPPVPVEVKPEPLTTTSYVAVTYAIGQ
jgi:uncharacterized protein YggE